jgi:hypothetical protein
MGLALAILAAAIGALYSYFALSASRVLRRVFRLPTSTVANLTDGEVELAGKLTSSEPLRGVDDAPAIAARWTVHARVPSDENSAGEVLTTEVIDCAPVELTDSTGTVMLVLRDFVLLGSTRRYRIDASELKTRCPTLSEWFKPPKELIGLLLIEETLIPDGAEGFVCGVAALSETPRRGDAYRDAKRRFELSGTPAEPLVLSEWSEPVAKRLLMAPILRLATVALLLFVVAVLAAVVPAYVRASTGG